MRLLFGSGVATSPQQIDKQGRRGCEAIGSVESSAKRARSRPSGWTMVLIMMLASSTAGSAATVTLSPGANLQTAILSHNPGTTFTLMPGNYRMQGLIPKTGDAFFGQAGATLIGSMILTNWVKKGAYWTSAGDPELNAPYGPASLQCQSATSGCAYPQDLYVNNKPLSHQLALPIVSGQWYFDYTNDLVYMADDPAGQDVELSVTERAFSGPASNVKVENLTIERYATPLFSGALTPYGSGWIIQSNTIRLNHGEGIKLKGNNEQVLMNRFLNNGESGIAAGGGVGNVIKANQVSGNNYAKCSYTQDSGGMKISHAQNTQILNNTVTNNDANGIWIDSQGTGTIISGNTVTGNTQNGIRHEYSSYGTISNNILKNNGQNPVTKACNFNIREIVAADSNHVTITGNTITSNCGGITLTQGASRLVLNVPVDLVVTDNTTTYSSSSAIALTFKIGGTDSETPPPLFNTANGNFFDYNTYHFSSSNELNLLNWMWGGYGGAFNKTWAQWRAAGQDIHGSAD